MELNKLSYVQGSRNHKSKRKARGFGSKMGKTATRGTKGQNSRKSGNVRPGFEGGQTPIYRRIGKVGFNNFNFSNDFNVVNIKDMLKIKGNKIGPAELLAARLIGKNKLPIKIIGNIKIDHAIEVSAHKFTAGAKTSITSGGGSIVELEIKSKVIERHSSSKSKVKNVIRKSTVGSTSKPTKKISDTKKIKEELT